MRPGPVGPGDSGAPLHILFLDEGRSYRFDNRARREVGTLRAAGAEVTVICPAYPGEPAHEFMDNGVECFRFPSTATEFRADSSTAGGGVWGQLREYASALPKMASLMKKVHHDHPFHAIHVVTPPDVLGLLAAPYKRLGVRIVFDHYDLNPELFEDRFQGGVKNILLPLVKATEKMSIRAADRVISTNESYREIAITRCGKPPEQVSVVRNGPDLERFRELPPPPEVSTLGEIIIGYLGNMNPQDGVDHFVEMARILRHEQARGNIGFLLVGSGDSYPELLALRDKHELSDCMMFTGRLPADEMVSHLCATDICVQPDPPSRLNNVSTMNKVMEYMALGKAVVAYDLTETRVSGGDACLYATGGEPAALAAAVAQLIDAPEERKRRADEGERRVREKLAWNHQEPALLQVYEGLFPGCLAASTAPPEPS